MYKFKASRAEGETVSLCLTCVRRWLVLRHGKQRYDCSMLLIECNVPVSKTQINKCEVPLSLRIQKNVSLAPSLRIATARQGGAGEMAEH